MIFIISGKQHPPPSLAIPQPRHCAHWARLGWARAAHRQRATPAHGRWPEASPGTRVAADPPGLLPISCPLYEEPLPRLHELQRWTHTILRRLQETLILVTFVLYPMVLRINFWKWRYLQMFCVYAYFIVKWFFFPIKKVSSKSINNCWFCECFFHFKVFNDAQYIIIFGIIWESGILFYHYYSRL